MDGHTAAPAPDLIDIHFNGRNLTDDSLPEVLSQLPEGPALVHLCSNRLDIPGMRALVVHMKQHDGLSFCVWNNKPYFEPWYRMLQQEGVSGWVYSGRLRYGGHSEAEQDLARAAARSVDAGRYQEQMRARLEEVVAIQATTAQLQRELTQLQREDAIARKALTHDLTLLRDSIIPLHESTDSIRNWQTRLTDRYELLVTQLVRLYLHKIDEVELDAVGELPRMYHKILSVPVYFPRGVEWDGVLFVPEEGDRGSQLYLIEAKSALVSAHVKAMPERMCRTVEFLRLCGQQDFRQAAAKHLLGDKPTRATKLKEQRYTALCNEWGQYSSAVAVYGVVGGIGFTQAMLADAQANGLLIVAPAHGLYEVSSPPGGLRSATLPSLAPDATLASTPGGLQNELPSSATGAGDAPTAPNSGGQGAEQPPTTVVISEAELRQAVAKIEVLEPDILECV
jgi:hypothetical protein